MKKLVISSIAALGLIGTTAFGADMPVKGPPSPPLAPPPPRWTGFYIGIDAGGAWWGSKQSLVESTSTIGQIIDPVGFGSGHQVGAVGGFLAGYNWQFSPIWVIGVEGDFNWASLSSRTTT
jgi:outer membrane immunogenic protein